MYVCMYVCTHIRCLSAVDTCWAATVPDGQLYRQPRFRHIAVRPAAAAAWGEQWSWRMRVVHPQECWHHCQHTYVHLDSPPSTRRPKSVAWHSGRTSVIGRRTFPVLRSTCSWWVTTYVGKPSATGQPTRPTQPFILSRLINWVVSCNRMFSSSHGWRRLVNAYGVKAWCGYNQSSGVFVSCITRVHCTLTRAIGWPQFALQHHVNWLLPIKFRDCKARWSGHRVSCVM